MKNTNELKEHGRVIYTYLRVLKGWCYRDTDFKENDFIIERNAIITHYDTCETIEEVIKIIKGFLVKNPDIIIKDTEFFNKEMLK